MIDSRSARRAVCMIGIAAAVAVPAFVLSSAPQQTDASWTATKAAVVTTTAVIPTPPTGLTCQASGLLAANVPFNWTAPPGTVPSGYTLKGAAGGPITSTTPSANVPAPLGTITISVYADYGSWESSAGIQTRSITGVVFVGWTCGP